MEEVLHHNPPERISNVHWNLQIDNRLTLFQGSRVINAEIDAYNKLVELNTFDTGTQYIFSGCLFNDGTTIATYGYKDAPINFFRGFGYFREWDDIIKIWTFDNLNNVYIPFATVATGGGTMISKCAVSYDDNFLGYTANSVLYVISTNDFQTRLFEKKILSGAFAFSPTQPMVCFVAEKNQSCYVTVYNYLTRIDVFEKELPVSSLESLSFSKDGKQVVGCMSDNDGMLQTRDVFVVNLTTHVGKLYETPMSGFYSMSFNEKDDHIMGEDTFDGNVYFAPVDQGAGKNHALKTSSNDTLLLKTPKHHKGRASYSKQCTFISSLGDVGLFIWKKIKRARSDNDDDDWQSNKSFRARGHIANYFALKN